MVGVATAVGTAGIVVIGRGGGVDATVIGKVAAIGMLFTSFRWGPALRWSSADALLKGGMERTADWQGPLDCVHVKGFWGVKPRLNRYETGMKGRLKTVTVDMGVC